MDNEDKKTFEQLSDAEKGALLLAKHNDVDIEVFMSDTTWLPAPEAIWLPENIYRVKPDPEFDVIWKYPGGFISIRKEPASPHTKYVEIAALKLAIDSLKEYELNLNGSAARATLKRLEGLV